MKKILAVIFDVIVLLIIIGVAIFLVAFKGYDWRAFSILFLSIYLIDFIFIFYMLIKEDELHEKFVWVFFLVVFPIISHIIFTLFRIRRTPGISRKKYEKQLLKIYDTNEQENLNPTFLNEFEKQQAKLTNRNFYWTDIKLYTHGFDAYQELFDDLNQAQRYIHIQMYIIKKSEIFEKFKDILIKKAKAGVEVKIILDSFGTWLVRYKEIKYLIANGVEVLMFNKTIYPIVKPTDNNRLHRKFFVVDGKIVHAGGLNISDEYGSYSKDYGYWADLNFRITGSVVNEYERLFLYDWNKLTKHPIDSANYWNESANQEQEKSDLNQQRILLFDEGPNNEGSLLENTLLNWIYNTKKTIKISTPYFIPTKQVFNAFVNALKKGVNIEFYIPGKPDKKIIYYGTYFYLKKLLDYGAKVYIIQDIFLHSKLGIFDDEFAYIGTNNLDMRSFYTNYELINVIQGEAIIKTMNQIFDQYKLRSKQLFYWYEGKIKSNTKKIIYEVFAPLM